MWDEAKRRGRPTTCNRDGALDAAARLFWRHGYEGTSLAMLTATLGCTPPTRYAAFSSKAGLYRKALTAYRRHDIYTPGRAPSDLSPYETVDRYLRAAAGEQQIVRRLRGLAEALIEAVLYLAFDDPHRFRCGTSRHRSRRRSRRSHRPA